MKKPLSAAEASALLNREFLRLKAKECESCVPATPFWGPGVVMGAGYWYLNALQPCPFECRQVLAQVWAGITTEYEVERPAYVEKRTKASRIPARSRNRTDA